MVIKFAIACGECGFNFNNFFIEEEEVEEGKTPQTKRISTIIIIKRYTKCIT